MSEFKGLKWIGPVKDNSGYAKASRGYVLALHRLGVPITISPISFEEATPDLGEDGKIIDSLIDKDIDYNVNLMHCTPEFWSKFREPDKVNIGYTIWETTKLHPDWPPYINNHVDKVLVGCEWNIKVFKESGVTIPIASVPHAIPIEDSAYAEEYQVEGISKDVFIFGSVFQFTERKDPLSLIKAYWYAFQNDENVALVLKTYRNDYSPNEQQVIINTINRLKEVTLFDKYPRIYLILDMLTENQMRGLYNSIDCYVTLDRGEGFGLGPFQAGAYGKPVIATGFGGVMEYLTEDNSYLVDYTLNPVFGMPYSRWYRAEQLWGQADIVHGAQRMREVYENQKLAKEKGQLLQQSIHNAFNEEVIASKMMEEIKNLK